jgi:PTS system nitrogen regulatory IIA component
MDLKIKDVAELLKVSETTVRRWLTDGKIPAYRLNHQYRFSRMEIEDWVMSRKLTQPASSSTSPHKSENESSQENDESNQEIPGGSNQFSLYRAVNKGDVYDNIPGNTKEEVILAAMKLIARRYELDADVISELLLDRERLMPTALNHGLAVPHTRDFLLNTHYDVISIVFPQKPIEYGALDGKPVHTLFFLFACKDKRHLHLLAKLAHLSSNVEALKLLESHPNKNTLLEFIKGWESNIKTLK